MLDTLIDWDEISALEEQESFTEVGRAIKVQLANQTILARAANLASVNHSDVLDASVLRHLPEWTKSSENQIRFKGQSDSHAQTQ